MNSKSLAPMAETDAKYSDILGSKPGHKSQHEMTLFYPVLIQEVDGTSDFQLLNA
ncbi:MAG: hypothetical protein ACPGED_08585 [Flavobacteriales bacterium]